MVLSSGQKKPLITQEECWEFFADNMAPFTSPSSTRSLRTDVLGVVMQEEQAKEILMTFLEALATSLTNVDTYKVFYTCTCLPPMHAQALTPTCTPQ